MNNKLKPQRIFVPVSVDDELPPHTFRGFVLTKRDNGIISEKKATFYSTIKYNDNIDKNVWIIDDNWKEEVVTHWLKEQDNMYCFSASELSEFVKEQAIKLIDEWVNSLNL